MNVALAHLLALVVLGLGGPAPVPGPVPVPGPTPVPVSTEGAAPAQGAGTWPLSPTPEVVADFDPPETRYAAGHRGVDLLGSTGQPVRAARAGTVTFAGRLAGRGVVVVAHGPTRTTYEPVTASVAVGDLVASGQRIGSLELFGSHCWPRSCLHWGLVEGDTYLDPLTLVGAGPVRLLPLFSDLPTAPTPLGSPGSVGRETAGVTASAAPPPHVLAGSGR